MERPSLRSRRRPAAELLEARQLLALSVHTLPADQVTWRSAVIGVEVAEIDSVRPDIFLYWGDDNAGTEHTKWDHRVDFKSTDIGRYTITLDPLAVDTPYYYRGFVLNVDEGQFVWTDVATFRTLPPVQPALQLRISEFMAANGTQAISRTRPTVDGKWARTKKAYDWIEIENATATPWDVSGYYLTDDRQWPLKWQFPDGTIVPPQSQLVVYASGEDVRNPALDEQGRLHTNFQLSSEGEYLGLLDRAGQVVHEYRNVPAQRRDVSYGMFANSAGSFPTPTPGQPNGPLAPQVTDVTHRFATVDGAPGTLVVTARVAATISAVSDVRLQYRVMYGVEQTVVMRDDGVGTDAQAADGLFTAVIGSAVATPGQMIRYYVTATSANGLPGREPSFVDPEASPEYYGTIVDPNEPSPVPVLHWFVETPSRADTDRGTRASLFYDGEFYDNVFVRNRGGTARSWPKKSYKIEFNDDHQFLLQHDVPRVDEINLNATYTDKSYVRAVLTSEFQLDAGTPSPETYHVRVQRNAQFFSLALVVEQPDLDFLRRYGLDPEGALYKGGPGSTYSGGTGSFEKKNRDDDDRSDVTAFVQGLRLRGEPLERFLFDNVNLPAQINFMATNIIAQNIDASDKNHYLYRDTNGTGEWFMMPWDLDLVFGPDALTTDMIVADENTRGATYPNAVHPFLGSQAWPLHAGKINMFLDAVITTPRTREMLLRRMRTLTDQYLASGYFQQRMDELVQLLADVVPLDRGKWKNNAHFTGSMPAFDQEVERIKSSYLDRRLTYLTDYQVTRGAGQRDFVGVPQAQPPEPPIQFGDTVVYHPDSGNQAEEYFTLRNANDFAVDVSGWKIVGATSTTLQPGTVIPAGGVLYLSPDVPAFRARRDGPAGNQGLFVQSYATELPDRGGELRLQDASGRAVSQTVFGLESVPASADNLRITELHFNPHDGLPQFGELLAGGSNFEFVELANVSANPIELAGVRFVTHDVNGSTEGIAFAFASQTLEVGERIVIVSNSAAFQSRYGTRVRIAAGDDGQGGLPGQYAQNLGNGGETLTLVDASGGLMQRLAYDDATPWPLRADGSGSSLELVDPRADYTQPANWRASSEFGGSPGAEPAGDVRNVVINEVLANSVAPWVDQIELMNTSNQPVDVSRWYLSDSSDNLLKFQIPADIATIPPGGFLVFDQRELGFGFKGQQPDDAWLIAADAAGRPLRFADHLEFDAAPPLVSLGRWPDGRGRLYALPQPTFGQSNSRPNDLALADFDDDGRVNAADIDLLAQSVRHAQYDRQFDLNGDDRLSFADQEILVRDVLKTTFGDANLDRRFDSQDLTLVFSHAGYEDDLAGNATWGLGDWNGDGEFDSQDFVFAFSLGGWS